MVGHGGSSAGSYLADPTSPIPSHCASIVVTSTLRVNTFASILDESISWWSVSSTCCTWVHYLSMYTTVYHKNSSEIQQCAAWFDTLNVFYSLHTVLCNSWASISISAHTFCLHTFWWHYRKFVSPNVLSFHLLSYLLGVQNRILGHCVNSLFADHRICLQVPACYYFIYTICSTSQQT